MPDHCYVIQFTEAERHCGTDYVFRLGDELTKHVVGFSGGIDSQACAGWVLDHFPHEDVILMNSDAGGNEHPLTTEHIECV